MVTVEPCSNPQCGGMSIDGLDGKCNYCLRDPEITYKITITKIITAKDEEYAEEQFIKEVEEGDYDIEMEEIERN